MVDWANTGGRISMMNGMNIIYVYEDEGSDDDYTSYSLDNSGIIGNVFLAQKFCHAEATSLIHSLSLQSTPALLRAM
jgi:hypothetical protein